MLLLKKIMATASQQMPQGQGESSHSDPAGKQNGAICLRQCTMAATSLLRTAPQPNAMVHSNI
jgi:hypothetical protein